MHICKICQREFTSIQAVSSHTWRSHSEKGQQFKPTANKTPWNKGLTKRDSKAVAAIAEANHLLAVEGKRKKQEFTAEKRKRLSDLAKQRGLGGYRPHPNRGMRYNGIWFDSAWEVRVAKILDEHKVRWERPKVGFKWTDDGRKYYPDFFLPDHQLYLDPKNDYLIGRDAQKIAEAQSRNQIRVHVLNESQLTWEHIQTLL